MDILAALSFIQYFTLVVYLWVAVAKSDPSFGSMSVPTNCREINSRLLVGSIQFMSSEEEGWEEGEKINGLWAWSWLPGIPIAAKVNDWVRDTFLLQRNIKSVPRLYFHLPFWDWFNWWFRNFSLRNWICRGKERGLLYSHTHVSYLESLDG